MTAQIGAYRAPSSIGQTSSIRKHMNAMAIGHSRPDERMARVFELMDLILTRLAVACVFALPTSDFQSSTSPNSKIPGHLASMRRLFWIYMMSSRNTMPIKMIAVAHAMTHSRKMPKRNLSRDLGWRAMGPGMTLTRNDRALFG